MRLVLIRHGQTPSNVCGLLDTAPPGPGLTHIEPPSVDLAMLIAVSDARSAKYKKSGRAAYGISRWHRSQLDCN